MPEAADRRDNIAIRSSLRQRSADLLHGRREIEIEHAGRIYRLRVTASGKLILTG